MQESDNALPDTPQAQAVTHRLSEEKLCPDKENEPVISRDNEPFLISWVMAGHQIESEIWHRTDLGVILNELAHGGAPCRKRE